ncbi:MAG: FkbM family methyltransferase [Candidatus Omnitrophica bacterium]|nr:FkbM family methyltransferase [Candidatus Omnitrophota bacterium]
MKEERFSSWAYHPLLVRFARAIGLQKFMRRVYYLLRCPAHKIKNIRFEGIDASFYVRDPSSLRAVETPFADCNGDERRSLRMFLGYVRSDDTVLDVGASIGIYTVFLARKLQGKGRVIAIEPHMESFRTLQENIALNGLRNAVAFQSAFADAPGRESLYTCGASCDFSFVRRVRDSRSQEIALCSGDSFIEEHGFTLPAIIKIDVEGYEACVLKGLEKTLSRAQCRLVFCEMHPRLLPSGVCPEDIRSFLEGCGFLQKEDTARADTRHWFFLKEAPR